VRTTLDAFRIADASDAVYIQPHRPPLALDSGRDRETTLTGGRNWFTAMTTSRSPVDGFSVDSEGSFITACFVLVYRVPGAVRIKPEKAPPALRQDARLCETTWVFIFGAARIWRRTPGELPHRRLPHLALISAATFSRPAPLSGKANTTWGLEPMFVTTGVGADFRSARLLKGASRRAGKPAPRGRPRQKFVLEVRTESTGPPPRWTPITPKLAVPNAVPGVEYWAWFRRV